MTIPRQRDNVHVLKSRRFRPIFGALHLGRVTLKKIVFATFAVLSIAAGAKTALAQETRVATFAGGCFWCIRSDFDRVPGVLKTISGYTGGRTKDPTYKKIVRGDTGHHEALQITYDPKKLPTNSFSLCSGTRSIRSTVVVSSATGVSLTRRLFSFTMKNSAN